MFTPASVVFMLVLAALTLVWYVDALAAEIFVALRSALVANIGDDREGGQCLAVLNDEKVVTDFVAVHKEIKTNYHYVLWYGDDRTILVKHEKYPHILPDIGAPRWLYLSSLGESTEEYHDAIAAWCTAHPETLLAFQPGTFQIKLGAERLRNIYQNAEIVFCNKEEAEKITGMAVGSDIKELFAGLHALGPKIVVITDGAAGAYALHEGSAWHMPAYQDPKPPYERTGAGDAFASTLVSALALGKPFSEALRWGAANAMSVVQQVGARAGLLTAEKIEEYLQSAPADFIAKKRG